MRTPSLISAVLALGTIGAIAAPTEVQSRDDTNVGVLFAYPQSNYQGTPVLLEVVQYSTPFCQVFANSSNSETKLPFKSYKAVHMLCFSWASRDCTGSSNGPLIQVRYIQFGKHERTDELTIGNNQSGQQPAISYNVGSLVCLYNTS